MAPVKCMDVYRRWLTMHLSFVCSVVHSFINSYIFSWSIERLTPATILRSFLTFIKRGRRQVCPSVYLFHTFNPSKDRIYENLYIICSFTMQRRYVPGLDNSISMHWVWKSGGWITPPLLLTSLCEICENSSFLDAWLRDLPKVVIVRLDEPPPSRRVKTLSQMPPQQDFVRVWILAINRHIANTKDTNVLVL